MKWMNSVRVLRVRPGDTLVLNVDHPLSEDALANIVGQGRELFPDNKFVVTMNGVELSVIRAEEAA